MGIDAYHQWKETGTISNGAELLGAAAAGAVSGALVAALVPVVSATLFASGLSSGAATITGEFLVGGTANLLGNQTGALVEGALSTEQGESFWNNYSNAGGIYDGNSLTNLQEAAGDVLIGGTVNAGMSYTQHLASGYFDVADTYYKPPNYGNYNSINNVKYPTQARIIQSNKLATSYGVRSGVVSYSRKFIWDTINSVLQDR